MDAKEFRQDETMAKIPSLTSTRWVTAVQVISVFEPWQEAERVDLFWWTVTLMAAVCDSRGVLGRQAVTRGRRTGTWRATGYSRATPICEMDRRAPRATCATAGVLPHPWQVRGPAQSTHLSQSEADRDAEAPFCGGRPSHGRYMTCEVPLTARFTAATTVAVPPSSPARRPGRGLAVFRAAGCSHSSPAPPIVRDGTPLELLTRRRAEPRHRVWTPRLLDHLSLIYEAV